MTRMLKKALEDVLSEKESDELISAFDQIGDIIIVRIPDSLLAKKKVIGKTLLENVKTAILFRSFDKRGEKNAFCTSTTNLHPNSLYSVSVLS